jgi:4-hydroxyacetophenone monooxygenase
LENIYPGCRVDVTNHLFSFSFAQRYDWPQRFSTQDVLLDYFRSFADDNGLRDHIRFGTEVTAVELSDEDGTWTLRLRTANGDEETIEAGAVVSAVGQLNRPNYPKIPGVDDFGCPSFHSARWDYSVDLKGKRVAVIGTGASALQFVPIIAEQASELFVFQRTAPWLAPTPDYHDEVAPGLQWLFRHVPYYPQWYRFWLFCTFAEGLLAAAQVDPDWQPRDRSVSAGNEELRKLLVEYLELQLSDHPDLLEKVVPNYPPAAKRMLRDNGVWAATLTRDNVHLITDGIDRILDQGVATGNGDIYDVDVLIYATGFQASRFLMPMTVRGRGGVDLHQRWDGDARAYLGITIPDFPNFFCLYGPNTNIVVNGSIIFFSECEVNYVMGCLQLLLERNHRTLDCRREVHDSYNVEIDEANRLMSWGASSVNSWYKNEHGRVSQNWPFSLWEYWRRTKQPDPKDYNFL